MCSFVSSFIMWREQKKVKFLSEKKKFNRKTKGRKEERERERKKPSPVEKLQVIQVGDLVNVSRVNGRKVSLRKTQTPEIIAQA